MSISYFLKHVYLIERSGWVNLDTEQISLEKESQNINWELIKHPTFKVFYEYGQQNAVLFIFEKGQKEKLMQVLLPLDEDPCTQLSRFDHRLNTIIQISSSEIAQ